MIKIINLEEIGTVKSEFKEPANPEKMRKSESLIVIKSEYEEGLYKIEDCQYLQVLFYLHLSDGYTLKGRRRMGKERGVFASRSPRRPNPIGITTVKLLNKDKNRLKVKGLDAIEGTPIIDLKPYSSMMDEID